jgi:hypothetical protein
VRIIQGDSRIVSDLAPLFLPHKLVFYRILRRFDETIVSIKCVKIIIFFFVNKSHFFVNYPVYIFKIFYLTFSVFSLISYYSKRFHIFSSFSLPITGNTFFHSSLIYSCFSILP